MFDVSSCLAQNMVCVLNTQSTGMMGLSFELFVCIRCWLHILLYLMTSVLAWLYSCQKTNTPGLDMYHACELYMYIVYNVQSKLFESVSVTAFEDTLRCNDLQLSNSKYTCLHAIFTSNESVQYTLKRWACSLYCLKCRCYHIVCFINFC